MQPDNRENFSIKLVSSVRAPITLLLLNDGDDFAEVIDDGFEFGDGFGRLGGAEELACFTLKLLKSLPAGSIFSPCRSMTIRSFAWLASSSIWWPITWK
jgi:hypothetical protein